MEDPDIGPTFWLRDEEQAGPLFEKTAVEGSARELVLGTLGYAGFKR